MDHKQIKFMASQDLGIDMWEDTRFDEVYVGNLKADSGKWAVTVNEQHK